jgi:pyruvate dehydrogenase (quinone)
MAKRVADLLVDVLSEAGVQRVYGDSGDSLNGITDSIRAPSGMNWIPVRHEEAPAFAVGAEAHLTGKLAVCAGSCGEYLGLKLAFLTAEQFLHGAAQRR